MMPGATSEQQFTEDNLSKDDSVADPDTLLDEEPIEYFGEPSAE